mgnify:CR=1 FL=1
MWSRASEIAAANPRAWLERARIPEEIAALPMRADGLRLRDVADVQFTEPPLEYGRHLDGDFAVGVTVSKEAGANAVEICDAVEKRVAAMNDDPELEGVNFLVWFSQGHEIRKTLRDLLFTGTPAGVGVFRDPQVFLKPDDVVTVEIEGIGRLVNPVSRWRPRG